MSSKDGKEERKPEFKYLIKPQNPDTPQSPIILNPRPNQQPEHYQQQNRNYSPHSRQADIDSIRPC